MPNRIEKQYQRKSGQQSSEQTKAQTKNIIMIDEKAMLHMGVIQPSR